MSVSGSAAFARFYAGQTLSYLGDGLRTLVLPLVVFQLTGSATALGWMWGLELTPFALLGVVGGSLADRVDRRRLMLACDGMRFCILTAFCILLATGRLTLPITYAGVIALAAAAAFFLSAQMPSIPYLVGKDGTKAAIASLQATEQSMNLVAPPLGGAILGALGPLPALAINAGTYLCSQAAIASVRSFGPEVAEGVPSPRRIASDIVVGWRGTFADPPMAATSAFSFLFNVIASVSMVALIPYFKRAFSASDLSIGIAFGCCSASAALGSYLAGRTHWRPGIAFVTANLIDSLGWLAAPWTHSMPIAVGGIAISSLATGYYGTTIVSWRMRVVSDDLIGRVFGIVRLIAVGGVLPGSVAGGWMADHLGARPTIALSAYGYIAVSLCMAALPFVRNERR